MFSRCAFGCAGGIPTTGGGVCALPVAAAEWS